MTSLELLVVEGNVQNEEDAGLQMSMLRTGITASLIMRITPLKAPLSGIWGILCSVKDQEGVMDAETHPGMGSTS